MSASVIATCVHYWPGFWETETNKHSISGLVRYGRTNYFKQNFWGHSQQYNKSKKNTISFDSTLSSLLFCWEGLAGIRWCFLSHFVSRSVLNTVQYLNTLEPTFNSEVRKPHVSKDHLIICSTYVVGLKIIHTLMIHFVTMVMSGSPKAVQIKNKQIKGNSYVSYNLM